MGFREKGQGFHGKLSSAQTLNPVNARATLQHMERDVVLLAMGGFDHLRTGSSSCNRGLGAEGKRGV